MLARGTRIRLTDPDGDACAHLLLHRADAPHERLNVADTVKVPWQAYLGAGHPLLSGFGRVLATVVADTSAAHDALDRHHDAGGQRGAGTARAHRSRRRLPVANCCCSPRSSTVSDRVTCRRRCRSSRACGWAPTARSDGRARRAPARTVDLLLHVDAIVSLANTAHPLDPRPDFTCSPLRVHAWPAAGDLDRLVAGDLVGPLGPEHLQAVANTDADLTARGVL